MKHNHTPQLDTQQIGRAAGQEAQAERPFARWYTVSSLSPAGTVAGANLAAGWSLVTAHVCDASIATVGTMDETVATPPGLNPAIGGLILVTRPGGGTGMTYNGVAVNLYALPDTPEALIFVGDPAPKTGYYYGAQNPGSFGPGIVDLNAGGSTAQSVSSGAATCLVAYLEESWYPLGQTNEDGRTHKLAPGYYYCRLVYTPPNPNPDNYLPVYSLDYGRGQVDALYPNSGGAAIPDAENYTQQLWFRDHTGGTITGPTTFPILTGYGDGTPGQVQLVFSAAAIDANGCFYILQYGGTPGPICLALDSSGNLELPGNLKVDGTLEVVGALRVSFALGDGVYPCGTGSITIGGGVITAIT